MSIKQVTTAFKYPNSGWTQCITRESGYVIFTLHRNDKKEPTHQYVMTEEEFADLSADILNGDE